MQKVEETKKSWFEQNRQWIIGKLKDIISDLEVDKDDGYSDIMNAPEFFVIMESVMDLIKKDYDVNDEFHKAFENGKSKKKKKS